MIIQIKTLKELPRLALDEKLRRHFLERYAISHECVTVLRNFARWLQHLGFGVSVLPAKPCPEIEPASEIPRGALSSDDLHFSDERGDGFVVLGSPTKVFRYSSALPEPVEWRRWSPTLKLEKQRGTPFIPWGDGWLTLAYEVPRESKLPILHRFLLFGSQLDLQATSPPWTLPSGKLYRAHNLSQLPSGDFLLESHDVDTGRTACDLIARDTIESSLVPRSPARLELQDPVDLYNLRYLSKSL